MKHKYLIGLLISTLIIPYAQADVIKVSVKTLEKNAAAIGYKVDGKDMGGLGKSYNGKGPSNKEYFFGYIKDTVFGTKVACGSLVLEKDSVVTLINKDNQCISLAE